MRNIRFIVIAGVFGLASTILSSVFFAGAGHAEGAGTSTEAAQAAFRRGRTLSVTECMSCHRVYRPAEYSPEEWPGIVRKMGGRVSLTEGQIKDLEVYFVTAAGAARPPRKK